jgi:hypothetical protein
MNDCSNADIRDQLPDLLHDRLNVTARAAVVAHVDSCVDCRDELELLRGVRAALVTQAPRIDIAYVVGALPKPPARTIAAPLPRRHWADWRVAAAVTLLVAGGSSVALLNRAPNAPDTAQSAIVTPALQQTSPAAIASTSPSANSNSASSTPKAPNQTLASADDQEADVGPDGRFAGLNDTQLKALLGEIDRLEAVPVTEPDPVMIKVNLANPGSPEGTR